ncbi:hypothetical protein BGZ94_003808 [Podila epigama]|nr:hypothetical protein BGZ94_003808 [Podila epigama]
MHNIRGQALPKTFLEHPHDQKISTKPKKDKEKTKEGEDKENKDKGKKVVKDVNDKGISNALLTTTAFLGNMHPASSSNSPIASASASTSDSSSATTSTSTLPLTGRIRSSSSSSSLSVPSPDNSQITYPNHNYRHRSSSNSSSLLRHNNSIIESDKDRDQQQKNKHAHAQPQQHQQQQQRAVNNLGHGHTLANHANASAYIHPKKSQPSSSSTTSSSSSTANNYLHKQQNHYFLQPRQKSTPATLPPPKPPTSSSTSTPPIPSSSSSSSIFRRKKHAAESVSSTSINSHSILMVPQHDIHITWPHPVPSGNIAIAGTWSVPGHGPWEQLPMTPVEGTDSLFEIHLNVNEIENITDYIDDDSSLLDDGLGGKLSKRQRLRRFFGRAAKANKSNNSKDNATLAQAPPSNDSLLPLTKEYRYQYKFIVDGHWTCDVSRPQVQDNEGHWNHELVVELIEQIQPSSSSGSVRSRSSSLQSVQSLSNAHLSDAHPYQPPQQVTASTPEQAPLPAVEPDRPTLAPLQHHPKHTEEEIVNAGEGKLVSIKVSKKVRDTYEAVLIFDERDDLSDGENGRMHRSKLQHQLEEISIMPAEKAIDAIAQADKEDDSTTVVVTEPIATISTAKESPADSSVIIQAVDRELHEDNVLAASSSVPETMNHAAEHPKHDISASERDELIVAASVALPEESEGDSLVDDSVVESIAVAAVKPTVEAAIEAAVEPIIEPTVHHTVKSAVESTVEPIVEPIVVSAIEPIVEPTVEPIVAPTVGSTVESAVAPIVEPTVEPIIAAVVKADIEPTVEPSIEATMEPAVKSIVESTVAAAEEPIVESVLEPIVTSIVKSTDEPIAEPTVVPAIEPSSSAVAELVVEPGTPRVPEPRAAEEEESTFVLQEAANPEEQSRSYQPLSSSLSMFLSDDEEEQVSRPKSIAVITETTQDSGLSYQVPSPPLTPSAASTDNLTTSTFVILPLTNTNMADAVAQNNERETTDDLPEGRSSFESTTSTAVDEPHPRATFPLTPRCEHVPPLAHTHHSDKREEVEEEQVKVEARALQYNAPVVNSAVTSEAKSPSSSSLPSSSLPSSSTTTPVNDNKKEAKPTRDLPEKYPNLIWSICKTTAVVSAAVVIIGLGIGGRQRK